MEQGISDVMGPFQSWPRNCLGILGHQVGIALQESLGGLDRDDLGSMGCSEYRTSAMIPHRRYVELRRFRRVGRHSMCYVKRSSYEYQRPRETARSNWSTPPRT